MDPGADDPIAGRFLADQAAALAATGRVRPLGASFEPFWLNGDRALRARAAGARVLVAFDRPALDRLLPRCPAWLLDGLIVVTRGGEVPGAGRTVGLALDVDKPLADLLG